MPFPVLKQMRAMILAQPTHMLMNPVKGGRRELMDQNVVDLAGRSEPGHRQQLIDASSLGPDATTPAVRQPLSSHRYTSVADPVVSLLQGQQYLGPFQQL